MKIYATQRQNGVSQYLRYKESIGLQAAEKNVSEITKLMRKLEQTTSTKISDVYVD